MALAGLLAFTNTLRHYTRERRCKTQYNQLAGSHQQHQLKDETQPGSVHTTHDSGVHAGGDGYLEKGQASRRMGHRSPDKPIVIPINQPLPAPQELWDCLSILHCLAMETTTASALMLSAWFWVVLVATSAKGVDLLPYDFMAHGVNVVIALLEVVLTRLPMVSYHFQVMLWYGTAYILLLWIYGGASGTWRYGMNIQRGLPVGAFVLLPVLCFVFFGLCFLVAKLREKSVCGGKAAAAKASDMATEIVPVEAKGESINSSSLHLQVEG